MAKFRCRFQVVTHGTSVKSKLEPIHPGWMLNMKGMYPKGVEELFVALGVTDTTIQTVKTVCENIQNYVCAVKKFLKKKGVEFTDEIGKVTDLLKEAFVKLFKKIQAA